MHAKCCMDWGPYFVGQKQYILVASCFNFHWHCRGTRGRFAPETMSSPRLASAAAVAASLSLRGDSHSILCLPGGPSSRGSVI